MNNHTFYKSPRRNQNTATNQFFMTQYGKFPTSLTKQRPSSPTIKQLSQSIICKSNTQTNERLFNMSFRSRGQSSSSQYQTNNTPNNFNHTKKYKLVEMQQALRKLSQTNKVESYIDDSLDTRSQSYQPKRLKISHIQPYKFDQVKKEFGWWPLENLQRHLLDKFNKQSGQLEISEAETTTPAHKKKKKFSIDLVKKVERAKSVSHPINYCINLLNHCNIYLNQSKYVKELIQRKENSYNNQFDLIKWGEDENQERNFEEETKEYEKLNCEAVVSDLKNTNRNTRADRMYKKIYQKKTHINTRKMINMLTVDQQRIAFQITQI